MNLYSFFDAKTVANGIMMYKDGKVRNLRLFDSDSGCTALVCDLKDYGVIMRGLKGNWPTMICNCSMSINGIKCVHLAAASVAYNNQVYGVDSTETNGTESVQNASNELVLRHETEKKSITIFDLFPEITSGPEYYFDVQAMLKHLKNQNKTLAEQASKIIKRNNFENMTFSTYYTRPNHYWGSDFMNGKVSASMGSNGKGIVLYFDRDFLLKCDCFICNTFYEYNSYYAHKVRVCPHMIALLYHAWDFIRKNNPGDLTDINARNLLDHFNSISGNSHEDEKEIIEEKKADIILEPRVCRKEDILELSFKIGRDKMYILKNMTDFVSVVKNGGDIELGKNNVLNFSRECFTETSEKWYRFIEQRVTLALEENNKFNRSNRYYYQSIDFSLKDSITLSGSSLDDFYDLSQNCRVYYNDKSRQQKEIILKTSDEDIKIEISLNEYTEKNNKTKGIVMTGNIPEVFDGYSYSYCFGNNSISRIYNESRKVLEPFKIAAGNSNSFKLIVGRKGLQDFYYRLLPVLENSPCIVLDNNVGDELTKELPPEPKFTFYLDSEEGRFTCRTEVKYGNITHEVDPSIYNTFFQEYRDYFSEDRVCRLLKTIFPVYSEKEKLYTLDIDDDSVYTMLFEAGQELMKYGEVKGSEAFNRLKVRKLAPVRVGVSIESDIMNLSIKSTELSDDELLDVLASYKKKKKFHRLKSGDFIGLGEDNSLEQLEKMMNTLNLSAKDIKKGEAHVPLYRALYVNKLFEEHNEMAADRDRNFKKLIKNFKTIDESEYEIPAALKGVMRKYQEKGYKWLRTLSSVGFGGILADDMGLGKTLQAISVILANKNEGSLDKPALIVCPASLVYNWLEEFRRFAPDLTVRLIVGNQLSRKELLTDLSGQDVVITSYDLLKRDIILYEDMHFSWMIIDEAQYIKSNNAAVTKSVKVINAANRLALTGTPIENRLSELWSIFDFLMPGFLFGYERFKSHFENQITKNKDEVATDELKKMISPFILRRIKSDVLKDLPEKLEEVRYASFDTEQQKVYDAQVTHMKMMLASSGPEDKIKVLAELMKIRQICCDPSLIFENYKGESAKREACMELLRSAIDGGHRVLLFSQFVSMLELLEKDLDAEGIRYYKIVGATKKEDRLRLVKAFNEDDTPVFIISLKAGGTGLNLVGADIVIHYDPWWNLAAQNQATDRAHRIGQTKKVTVFRLIVKNTIEEKILKLQEEKKNLADAVLSGELTSLGSLSKEELLSLLGSEEH